MYYLRVFCILVAGYGRDAAGALLVLLTVLHSLVKKFLARHFENVGLVAAMLVLVAVSSLVHHFDPTAGGLRLEGLQLLATPALILFGLLHVTIYCYKNLLPTWWKYLKGDSPKLFSDVLPNTYREMLEETRAYDCNQAKAALSYYRLKFTIRCVRTCFALLPFACLLYLAYRLTVLALTLSPH